MNVLLEKTAEPQIQGGHRANFTAKKILRRLAAAAIVLSGLLVISVGSRPASKDYISYWSAGRLLLHRADPYSASQVLALEKTQGYSEIKPIIMRNPPWALFLVVPLGFWSPVVGLLLWTIATVGCILIFIRLLNVSPEDRVFAFLFAPALAAICSGQSSPFLLLGFSLFLRFYRSQPFLAGASLFLMAIKPHLFLVFWVLLLVDCIYRRRFFILAGGTCALAVGTVFSMYLDVHVWQHYFAMLRASTLETEFFPTISMLFRLLIDIRVSWLLFVPSALAIVWGFVYYARNRHSWNWEIHGMLLMLVTVLVSPYGWFSDEIVLLPSLAFAFTFPKKRRYSMKVLVAIDGLALLILLMAHPSLSSYAYLWTPLAWTVWFLYSTDGSAKRASALNEEIVR
jgi:hypothetical protein